MLAPPTLDLEAEIEYEHAIRHELFAAANAPNAEQAILAARASQWQPDWYWYFEQWRAACAARAAKESPESHEPPPPPCSASRDDHGCRPPLQQHPAVYEYEEDLSDLPLDAESYYEPGYEHDIPPPTAEEADRFDEANCCMLKQRVVQKKKKEEEKKEKPAAAASWAGRECQRCHKPLMAIGNRRKNGKIGRKDWLGRRFHVACYKAHMADVTPLY